MKKGRRYIYPELHDRGWLNKKYWGEELSTYKIAEILGCTGQAVFDALNEFDIPRRSISESKKGNKHPLFGKESYFKGKSHTNEAKRKMSKDKRAFMARLKRIYKENQDPTVKELQNELKKRRMEFYTRDDGKKTLAFVHRAGWQHGKSPRDHEWSNYFREWDDDKEDGRETLLVWTEEFGTNPLGGITFIKEFIDEEEDDEDVSYIQ